MWKQTASTPQLRKEYIMNITQNEFALLRAIDDSEFGETLTDGTWSFSIADNSSLKPTSVGGIVTSLKRKGLVSVGGSGTDDAHVAMTLRGAELYTNMCAMGGLKVNKRISWDVEVAVVEEQNEWLALLDRQAA